MALKRFDFYLEIRVEYLGKKNYFAINFSANQN